MIIFGVVSLFIFDDWVKYYYAQCAASGIIGLTLVFSAIQIRRTIQHTELVESDQKIVIVHSINFCVFSLIYAVEAILAYFDESNTKRKFAFTIS